MASDGVGEFDVVYQAHAGAALGSITPGTVAYVATGKPVMPQSFDPNTAQEESHHLRK